jgi:hypothetical protein
MKHYLPTLGRVVPATVNPPGYASVADNVKALMSNTGRKLPVMADGRPMPANPSVEDLASAGILFWGTPDQIFGQIRDFHDRIGGFGHFLLEGQAADLDHAETVDSMTLFAKEVYPRLQELKEPEAVPARKIA